MILFQDIAQSLLLERAYVRDMEEMFDEYAETGDISVVVDYLKSKKIDPKRLHSNTTIYRGVYLDGKKCDTYFKDWDKPQSLLTTNKLSSWTRSATVAKKYFDELGNTYQDGFLRFLLKYTTTPQDEVYDMNKFKEYRLSKYGWEQEVKCRPTGAVQIVRRQLPFLDDFVKGSIKVENQQVLISHYDLPQGYWTKLQVLLTGQKRHEDEKGIRFGINIENPI